MRTRSCRRSLYAPRSAAGYRVIAGQRAVSGRQPGRVLSTGPDPVTWTADRVSSDDRSSAGHPRVDSHVDPQPDVTRDVVRGGDPVLRLVRPAGRPGRRRMRELVACATGVSTMRPIAVIESGISLLPSVCSAIAAAGVLDAVGRRHDVMHRGRRTHIHRPGLRTASQASIPGPATAICVSRLASPACACQQSSAERGIREALRERSGRVLQHAGSPLGRPHLGPSRGRSDRVR